MTAADGAFSLACNGSATVALSVARRRHDLRPRPAAGRSPGGTSAARCASRATTTATTTRTTRRTRGADYSATFSTEAVAGLRIHDIQGASHVSPYRGALVARACPGVVTARRTNGFFIQDPQPDGDERTSEGVFVFTSAAPDAVARARHGGHGLRPRHASSAPAAATGDDQPHDHRDHERPTARHRAPADRADADRQRRPRAADDGRSRTTPSARRRRAGRPARPAVRPARGRDRLLREPRGHARPRSATPVVVGPTRSAPAPRASCRCSPTAARARASAHARGAILVRAFDRARRRSTAAATSTPSGSSLNDAVGPDGRSCRSADVRDRFSARSRAVVDYASATTSSSRTTARRCARRRAEARGHAAPAAATSSRSPPTTSRTSTGDDPQDAATTASRRQIVGQPQVARHPQPRGDPGQQRRRPPRRRRRRASRSTRLHRRDPGGRRPDLRVPPDRPGPRPGRRRAGRQHPRRLPVPHRLAACSFVDRPGGTATTATEEDAGGRAPQLDVQPGPRRPDQRGVGRQPQAAGRRVPLPRQAAVRDRQPLQLQGRRRPAVRPLPAAAPARARCSATARRRVLDAFVDSASSRSTRRAASSCSATSTTSSSRRRVDMLEQGADEQGLELVDLWHAARRTSATATSSRATARCWTTSCVSPALLAATAVPTSTPCTSTPSSRPGVRPRPADHAARRTVSPTSRETSTAT